MLSNMLTRGLGAPLFFARSFIGSVFLQQHFEVWFFFPYIAKISCDKMVFVLIPIFTGTFFLISCHQACHESHDWVLTKIGSQSWLLSKAHHILHHSFGFFLYGAFCFGAEVGKWENSFPTSDVCLEPEMVNEKSSFPFPFSLLHLPFTQLFSDFQGATINFVVM